jgi:hypothetical protein
VRQREDDHLPLQPVRLRPPDTVVGSESRPHHLIYSDRGLFPDLRPVVGWIPAQIAGDPSISSRR